MKNLDLVTLLPSLNKNFLLLFRESMQAGRGIQGKEETISSRLSTEQGAPGRAQSQNPEVMTRAEVEESDA